MPGLRSGALPRNGVRRKKASDRGTQLDGSGESDKCTLSHSFEGGRCNEWRKESIMDPEFVTVTITAYNLERYIADAIESVLGQTHPFFELLIVNDGSSDRTWEILQAYQERDHRIRIFDQPHVGNQATAINHMLQEARYSLIVHLDGDDIMLPNRIERQLAFMNANPDLVASAAFIYYINQYGKVIGRGLNKFITSEQVNDAKAANKLIHLTFSTLMYRLDAAQKVEGLREKCGCEDIDFYNRLIEVGKILTQPEYLVKYRVHKSSITHRRTRYQCRQTRWVEARMVARRSGLPEPTQEEYTIFEHRLPFLQRVRLLLRETGIVCYKKAVVAWADGQHVEAGFWGLLALLVRPRNVFEKLRRRRLVLFLVQSGIEKRTYSIDEDIN